jgi:hypothetical protein
LACVQISVHLRMNQSTRRCTIMPSLYNTARRCDCNMSPHSQTPGCPYISGCFPPLCVTRACLTSIRCPTASSATLPVHPTASFAPKRFHFGKYKYSTIKQDYSTMKQDYSTIKQELAHTPSRRPVLLADIFPLLCRSRPLRPRRRRRLIDARPIEQLSIN